jgi:outer membrane protein assembly factor BamB
MKTRIEHSPLLLAAGILAVSLAAASAQEYVAPVIQTVTQTNGMITFTWSAVVGQTYQVQYETNFTQGTWINLGSAIIAASSTMSASDSIGPDQARFYRIATGYFGQTLGTNKWALALNDDCIAAPATGPDGTIYLFQSGGELWAVNPDGSIKWQTNLPSNPTLSLAVGVNGTIYVAGGGGFYAVNPADGSTKWVFPTGIGNWYGAPAIGAGGTVYGCYESQVFAITNGAAKWTYPTNDTGDYAFEYGSPVVGADGTVYVCSDDGYLVALDQNGLLKWETNSPAGPANYPSSPAIGSDGTIYFGSLNYFSAVNPDGTIKWQYFTETEEFDLGPEVGPDGAVFIEAFPSGSGNNRLYAFNADGTVRWALPTAGSSTISPWLRGSSCALTADGRIYYGDLGGTIYAFNPDGTTNAMFNTGNVGLKPPIIGPDGTIYVVSFEATYSSETSYLYAFSNSALVACGPWPETGKNSRHTASVVRAALSSPVFANESFQFKISGLTNMPCAVCASQDLVTWTNIGSIALSGGATNFVDSNATNFPSRFYRGFPQ